MHFSRTIRTLRSSLGPLLALPERLRHADIPTRGDYKHPKVITGILLSRLNETRNDVDCLADVEFQVFSQFGDDGIIQYLIAQIEGIPKRFVEFGVEDFTEANTRFLLIKDKWQGLVFDGSTEALEYINNDAISWLFDLAADRAFVTAENINELIQARGFSGPLGILSIDVDGVDFWIWDAIRVCDPAIVVCEYNAIFGAERPITVPYDPAFVRSAAHSSRLYWGSSFAAICELASRKGYDCVGCNSNGNNVYFVKAELMTDRLKALKVEFVEASYGEFRVEGRQVRGPQRAAVIRGMPVYNVVTNSIEPF